MSAPAPRRVPERARGRLVLRCRAIGGTTRVDVIDRRPPLAVVRAFELPTGAALVHLHNVSGGVLGGDELETIVDVEPHARVQITTVGATQAYRAADGREALQRVTLRVAADAELEYLPDPLIPFAGSIYRQVTSVELEAGATFFAWEIVAPGRVAHGEQFAYERLRLETTIRAAGRLVALERTDVAPASTAVASSARLGDYGFTGSFFACRPGLDAARWNALERTLGDVAAEHETADARFGASTLAAHGVVVRTLASSRRAIAAGLNAMWRAARLELCGDAPIAPRKVG